MIRESSATYGIPAVIHSRSGAAVTAAEFPRLAPFIPSEKDDADTVKDLVSSHAVVDPARLADPSVPLADVRA